ncbi:MAG: hypothetical protein KAH44_07460, partial [Oricola sp.]|nr:hypothetical protein [Oricola sp.]
MRSLTDTEKQRVRDLLAELVCIDSAVSSTAQANRDHTEAGMADFIEAYVARLGMTVERRDVYPGRPNVI